MSKNLYEEDVMDESEMDPEVKPELIVTDEFDEGNLVERKLKPQLKFHEGRISSNTGKPFIKMVDGKKFEIKEENPKIFTPDPRIKSKAQLRHAEKLEKKKVIKDAPPPPKVTAPKPKTQPKKEESEKIKEDLKPIFSLLKKAKATKEDALKQNLMQEAMKMNMDTNVANNPIVLVDGAKTPNIEIDSTISLEEIERVLNVVDPTISPKPVEIKFLISKAEYQTLRKLAQTILQQYQNAGQKIDDFIMFRLEYAFYLMRNILKQECTGDAIWLLSTKIRVKLAQDYYDLLNEKVLEAQGTPFNGKEVRNMMEIINDHKNNRDALTQYMKDQGIMDPADQIEIKPTCYYCCTVQNSGKKMTVCDGCKTAVYCGATCQRDDWARHELACTNADPKAARMLTLRKFVKGELETFILNNPWAYESLMKQARGNQGIPLLTIVIGGGRPTAGMLNDPKIVHAKQPSVSEADKKWEKEYDVIFKQFQKIPNCLVVMITDPRTDEEEEKANEKLKKEGKPYQKTLEKTMLIDYVSVGVKDLKMIKESRRDAKQDPKVQPKKK
jgi:predicted secreted protein